MAGGKKKGKGKGKGKVKVKKRCCDSSPRCAGCPKRPENRARRGR